MGRDPSDVEVLGHLNLRCWSGTPNYDWVDAKVVGTSSILSTEVTLRDVEIAVYDSSEWSVHPAPGEKRICSYFDY